MKLIDSGEGKVPILSAVAILAISLTVNLPGLAISPVLGKLKEVFPHSTPLEVQLLNVLPNLVTIPFILCAGKICTPNNQLKVLAAGLAIFTATGVAYFFAKTMIALILLSCMLGVGCGLVIPLAASLISQNFSGKPRGTLLGAKSGLSNFSVIIATLFVGWVASKNWHYAFIVYFVPLIPLCLVPFMRSKYINQARTAPVLDPDKEKKSSQSFHFQGKEAVRMMWGAMIIYFLITYGALVISYYLPFTMASYGLSTSKVGVATSMFYLSATLAGFGLSKAIKATGVWTLQIGVILTTLSLYCIGFIHTYASYIIGIFLMGIGYGLVQPILYDKTSYFAPNDAKSTEYFAFLLTCNYVGISSIPFIVEFFGTFIKGSKDPSFPFILNAVILTLLVIVVIIKHKSFVVQAGVIPEGNGIIRQPSSVIAPGDRYVESSGHESSIHITTVPHLDTPEVHKPIITTDKTPEEATAHGTQILQTAESSLADAQKSIEDTRRQQAILLKEEAQNLEAKATEIHSEALELLEEANALEAPVKNETSNMFENKSVPNTDAASSDEKLTEGRTDARSSTQPDEKADDSSK